MSDKPTTEKMLEWLVTDGPTYAARNPFWSSEYNHKMADAIRARLLLMDEFARRANEILETKYYEGIDYDEDSRSLLRDIANADKGGE